MKALIYFILFYACIFLISLIPEDNFANAVNRQNESSFSNSATESSYTTSVDSVNRKLSAIFNVKTK